MKAKSMKRILVLPAALLALTSYSLPMNESISKGSGNGAVVNDSLIVNTTQGNFNAAGNSNVNAGVSAKGAVINDSVITSNVKGNVNAFNSNVNLGVKVDGATIDNSTVSSNTNVGVVNAINSNVNTGANLSGAQNANVSTNVSAGAINAVNSNVNVGGIRGNISNVSATTNVGVGTVNAVNQNVNIGTVKFGNSMGGGSRVFNKDTGNEAGYGNVNVESSTVKEVNVTVGESSGASVAEKIKARHMSRINAGTDGVDQSGTKHVYVEDKGKDDDKNSGNVTIGRGDHKVRKVDMFVEDKD
ncbi:MAG TPA: hypothetical protein DCZ94_19510 [Lentisphaeria bacterium]|nr:MAG: hypothetical protein A2X48_23815 [Lentisphaerae bacterium GWF2_49_21]HBC89132.1 hypothetical protein [Lentisphaeria bacterium]